MDDFINSIDKYKKSKKTEDLECLVERMSPLVKKYARLIHCMEYEDAIQELYVALIESLQYIDHKQGRAKCLMYITNSIKNRYYFLCKKNLILKSKNSNDLIELELLLDNDNTEDILFHIDLNKYIEKIYRESPKIGKTLHMSAIKKMTDKEIATVLNISK